MPAPITIAELHRIAAAYPPEAAFTPVDERERYFTDVQRIAWDIRFAGARPVTVAKFTEPVELCRG